MDSHWAPVIWPNLAANLFGIPTGQCQSEQELFVAQWPVRAFQRRRGELLRLWQKAVGSTAGKGGANIAARQHHCALREAAVVRLKVRRSLFKPSEDYRRSFRSQIGLQLASRRPYRRHQARGSSADGLTVLRKVVETF